MWILRMHHNIDCIIKPGCIPATCPMIFNHAVKQFERNIFLHNTLVKLYEDKIGQFQIWIVAKAD